MASIRARVIGGRRLQRKFNRLDRESQKQTVQAVAIGGQAVLNDYVAGSRQPGKGRVYTHRFWTDPQGRLRRGSRRSRPHRASAPGDPFASDTGATIGSADIQFFNGGLGASVGSNNIVARWMEFGTSKIAPRPSLVPAFERNREAIVRAIEVSMVQAVRTATRGG